MKIQLPNFNIQKEGFTKDGRGKIWGISCADSRPETDREREGVEGWDLFGDKLGGIDVNVGYFSHHEVGRMNPELQQKPHTHAFDEILFFTSGDAYDMSNLGMEADHCSCGSRRTYPLSHNFFEVR